MTINNQSTSVKYNWDGSISDLPIPFEINDPIQVQWAYTDASVVGDITGNVVKNDSGDWVFRIQA